MKQCNTCKETKPFSDYKPKRSTRDGYDKVCLACRAAEKGITEEDYVWDYLCRNIVGFNERARNRPNEYLRVKKWQDNNPNKAKEHRNRWKQNNPVIVRENARKSSARRHNRIIALAINDFTDIQWAELKDRFGNACAYCGSGNCALAMDHILPLSRGGQHTKLNIVPACKPCNSKKGSKTPEEAGMKIRDV